MMNIFESKNSLYRKRDCVIGSLRCNIIYSSNFVIFLWGEEGKKFLHEFSIRIEYVLENYRKKLNVAKAIRREHGDIKCTKGAVYCKTQ